MSSASSVRWVTLSIFLLVLLRVIGTFTILTPPSHPFDYSPAIHQLVAEIVVEERTGHEDEYTEYEVSGLWYDSAANRFHSIYDAWSDERLSRSLQIVHVVDWSLCVIVAGLVALRRHLIRKERPLSSLGGDPSHRSATPGRFLREFLGVFLIFAVVLVYFDHLRPSRSQEVAVLIRDSRLYNKFRASGSAASERWQERAPTHNELTYSR